eukprot:gene4897-6237_t
MVGAAGARVGAEVGETVRVEVGEDVGVAEGIEDDARLGGFEG